jgi:Flp pilus assembly protein TadD
MTNDVGRLAALVDVAADIAVARELADALAVEQPVAAMTAIAALQTMTSDPILHRLQVASLYVLAGDTERAAAIARATLPASAASDHLMAAATVLIGARSAADAIPMLRMVIDASPDHRDAFLRLAAASFQLGDIGGAISASASAFELDPTEPTPINNVMQMCAFDGTPIGALAAVAELRTTTHSPAIAVLLDIAHVCLMRIAVGELPPAGADAESDRVVTHLGTIAKSRPVAIQLGAARTLLEAHRHAEANALVQHVTLLPSLTSAERADACFLEALVAELAGDAERAVERYVAALAERSSLADAATNAIAVLLDANRPESLDHIETILDMVDSDVRESAPGLAFNESRFHAACGRNDEARACLERVIAVTRRHGEIAVLAHRALELTAHQETLLRPRSASSSSYCSLRPSTVSRATRPS